MAHLIRRFPMITWATFSYISLVVQFDDFPKNKNYQRENFKTGRGFFTVKTADFPPKKGVDLRGIQTNPPPQYPRIWYFPPSKKPSKN